MAEQRADDGIRGPGGRALKRRGILAAAGAVVAGIAAKQAARPVGAAGVNIIDSNDPSLLIINRVITPLSVAPDFNFTTAFGSVTLDVQTSGRADVAIRGTGTTYGVHGKGNFGVVGEGTGIGAFGKSPSLGVQGYIPGDSTSQGAIGVQGVVQGTGAGGVGVQGQIPVGSVAPNTIGVYGINSSSGANSIGVLGQSTSGYGVQGQSANTIGVFGATNGAGGNIAGVYGVSNASYGVIGVTTAAGYSGLTAITGTAGVAALAATSTVPTAFAAFFTGTTVVQGNFVATGGTKSAAVKDASGQHRLVYCVESPESWFEDFGEASLTNGTASVTLDKTFTEIAHTDRYQVFLATYGPSQGLDVVSRSSGGFTVQERNKGTGNMAFGYRVVAKRADIKGERLAKFDLPKINIPDESKLPKPAAPKKP